MSTKTSSSSNSASSAPEFDSALVAFEFEDEDVAVLVLVVVCEGYGSVADRNTVCPTVAPKLLGRSKCKKRKIIQK